MGPPFISMVSCCVDMNSGSDTSSNYRELRNLMDAMEEHVKNGKLREYEVFLLTYNLVTENALYKDSSSNNMLLNLIDQV